MWFFYSRIIGPSGCVIILAHKYTCRVSFCPYVKHYFVRNAQQMQKYRILICDDEEGILSYLKKLLRAQGMEVETFSSGRELLQRLREEQTADADLLLQDMKMPDMDGIQILREVKKLFPALPVIMMTAFGTIDAAVESIKLGAYDYVTKPFPKEKIFSVLANVLERGQFLLENQA